MEKNLLFNKHLAKKAVNCVEALSCSVDSSQSVYGHRDKDWATNEGAGVEFLRRNI